MFAPDAGGVVYENEVWYSDVWDPLKYGREYDFARPFFTQFKELLDAVPKPARSINDLENSDYCNNATSLKNCYLLFNANYSEDSLYGNGVDHCRDCVDNSHIKESEQCYEGFWFSNCHKVYFSSHCRDSSNIWFSKNLRGCHDCFGCVNLSNKQYYIFNQPYTKDDYEAQLRSFNLDSHASLQALKEKARTFWLAHPDRFSEGMRNEGVTGSYISNSQNVHASYLIREGKNLKYCQYIQVPPNEDCYDQTVWGDGNTLNYECCVCGLGSYGLKGCLECWGNVRSLVYSYHCEGSSYLFGCSGLRKKQYCIFNKQYTQEEYEALVPKIIEHMNAMPYVDAQSREYRYGEFFPPELSFFGYDETIASDFFPLAKEQAEAKGFVWRGTEPHPHPVTVRAADLPDRIGEVSESIVQDVIECAHKGECAEHCTTAFKIAPQELVFYMQQQLPLPRYCVNCRHAQRLKQRAPLTLHQRQCQCAGSTSSNGAYTNVSADHPDHTADAPCLNQFETSYVPDSPDIVYCETCYQKEIV